MRPKLVTGAAELFVLTFLGGHDVKVVNEFFLSL